MSSNCVIYFNLYRLKDGIIFKPVIFIFDILVHKVLLKKVNIKLPQDTIVHPRQSNLYKTLVVFRHRASANWNRTALFGTYLNIYVKRSIIFKR